MKKTTCITKRTSSVKSRSSKLEIQRKRNFSAVGMSSSDEPLSLISDYLCDRTVQFRRSGIVRHVVAVEMAEKSAFFEKLLKYQNVRSVILLPDCIAKGFEPILEYIRFGSTEINDKNVNEIYFASDFLMIDKLRQLCLDHYKILTKHPGSALNLWISLKNLYCPEINNIVYDSIMMNFEQIWQCKEFLSLRFREIFQILDDDQLCVANEKNVYLAALRWLSHNSKQNISRSQELILRCRLGFLKNLPTYLEKLKSLEILKDQYELISNLSNLQASITSPNKSKVDSIFRLFRPRKSYQAIMVFGGIFENNTPKALVQLYNPKCDSWSVSSNQSTSKDLGKNINSLKLLGEIPTRVHAGCAIIGSCVYLVGGLDGNEVQKSTLRFDFISETGWIEISCMHDRRYYVSVASTELAGGHVYALGGFMGPSNVFGLIGGRLKSCERLSLVDNNWVQISDMNLIRSDADACCILDKVYIVGGFDGMRYHDSGEVYMPGVNQWTLIKQMSTPRSGIALAALGGFIYAFGGNSGTNRLSSIERYDPLTDEWQIIGNMHRRRSHLSSAVSDDSIYLLGGWSDGEPTSGILNMVERFDLQTGGCEVLQPMQFPASATCTATLSGLSVVSRYFAKTNYRQTFMKTFERILRTNGTFEDSKPIQLSKPALIVVNKYFDELEAKEENRIKEEEELEKNQLNYSNSCHHSSISKNSIDCSCIFDRNNNSNFIPNSLDSIDFNTSSLLPSCDLNQIYLTDNHKISDIKEFYLSTNQNTTKVMR